MRLENIVIAGDYNKGVLQTYVVDGERWALLQGYTRKDLRILKEALEQEK